MQCQTKAKTHFFNKGPEEPSIDPDPILEEGATTSTVGYENEATLSEILGLPFTFKPRIYI